jgi:hypothetical protein
LRAGLNLRTPCVYLQSLLTLHLNPEMLDRDVISSVSSLAKVSLNNKAKLVSE